MDRGGLSTNARRARRKSFPLVRYLANSLRPLLPQSTSPKLKDDDDDDDDDDRIDPAPAGRTLSTSKRHSSSGHLSAALDSSRPSHYYDTDKRARSRGRTEDRRPLSRGQQGRRMSAQDGDKAALAAVTKAIAINALLLLSWYGNSVGISVFNKWVITDQDFHYPLFFTSFHMIMQFILAAAVLYAVPRFRPDHAASTQYSQLAQDQDEAREVANTSTDDKPKDKPGMTRSFYLTRIAPCAAATGLDIGLGNMSLRFITLTFYTMCKSSVLGFVLLFALIFRLEQPSLKIAAVIATMTIGVIMMVSGETAFDRTGFVLIMSAAFFSGFRWSLTQMMLLHNAATSNPFSSIFFLAPVMFVVLIVLAFPVEGVSAFSNGLHGLIAAKGLFAAGGVLLFPGLLAFLMTASEFALLKRTSVVTLSVCGIFKEVLMIVVSSTVFGDELTRINLSGLAITIVSIATYNYMKFTKMRDAARRDALELVAKEDALLGRGGGRELSNDGHRTDLEDYRPDSPASTGDRSNNETGHTRTTATLIQQSLGGKALAGEERRGSQSLAPPKRPEDHD